MGQGFEFSVMGVPVRVLPTFLVVLVFLGWGVGDLGMVAVWVALGFVAVLAHELGHALAYRGFGASPSIVLHGFGGLTFGRSLPVGQELLVTLAGPAVGIAVGLPLLGLYSAGVVQGTGELVLVMALFVTLGWSLLNLVPILPLDGGNALAAVLSLALRRDATPWVRYFSVVAAAALGIWMLLVGSIYLAILAGVLAITNVRAAATAPRVTRPARRARSEGGLPEETTTIAEIEPDQPPSDPQRPPVAVTRRPSGTKRGLEDEFASAAKAVLQGEPELALLAVARMRGFELRDGWLSVADQLEAWAWLQRGDLASARPLIERVPPSTVARRCLELGVELVEQEGALREVPNEVAHLAATGAATAEPDGGGAVALSVLAAEVARRGGAGAIGDHLRGSADAAEAEGATGALRWLSERLRIAGLTDAAGLLEPT